MVAKVEDCFLGREHHVGFGRSKLLTPWGVVRDGDPLHASSFFGASRSGDLPTTWTSHQSHVHDAAAAVGGGYYSKAGLQQNVVVQSQGSSVRLNAIAVPEPVTSPFASSYLMPGAAPVSAAAQPGRASTLAPGGLARKPSSESITSGSCSTPSFCVGSPVTVFQTRPSDSGSKDSDPLTLGPAFSESRVGPHPQQQPQLSDHYLSTDSLSYGSMEERDVIVNCVDEFWSSPHMVVGGDELALPEFRFEPMLDDTAMSFSVGELDPLVSTNHGPRQAQRGSLASMIQPVAPDQSFCQAFFAGDGDKAPIASSSTAHGSKPAQLAIPGKLANSGADHSVGARLRWSDQPWSGAPQHKSSSPSSPTTPLDPHLFATQTPSDALRADEIQKKLTEFSTATSNNSNSNKRSFAAMAGESKESTPLNADKFDAAALSALLYNNTQSNPEFRSAHASAPPVAAPKQRRRHGTATDPQSIAARTRREKFTDRIRVLQSLVPNGERLDTVHMLSQTFEYVRFLQHKVWDLYNGKDSLADVKCEKWKEFVDTATGQVIV